MKIMAGKVIKNVIWGAIKELGNEIIMGKTRTSNVETDPSFNTYRVEFDLRYPNRVSSNRYSFRPVALSLFDLGFRDSYQVHDNKILRVRFGGSRIFENLTDIHYRHIFRKRNIDNNKVEHVTLLLQTDGNFKILDIPDRVSLNSNDYELCNIQIKKER